MIEYEPMDDNFLYYHSAILVCLRHFAVLLCDLCERLWAVQGDLWLISYVCSSKEMTSSVHSMAVYLNTIQTCERNIAVLTAC